MTSLIFWRHRRCRPGRVRLPGRFFCLGWLMLAATAPAHDPLHDEDHHHATEITATTRESLDIDETRALLIAFRESGDDDHLEKAWKMIEYSTVSHNSHALVTAAFVAQARHEFDVSKELLRQALALDGNNDEAWLLLASVHFVEGNVPEAAAACRRLRDVHLLVVLTCNARVAFASGEYERTLTRMTGVLEIVAMHDIASDTLAWSYSVAGDLAVAAEEPQHAITLYEQSLELAERTQVRAALVDVFLSEGMYAEARRSLDAGSTALPLLVRKLIVAKRTQRLAEFDTQLARVHAEFDQWVDARDWLHAREMARFYFDVVNEPEKARRIARINLNFQREPEDQRLAAR